MSTPLRPVSPRRELPPLATCLATGQPTCRLGLPVEDCEGLRERLLWLLKVRDVAIFAAAAAVLAGFVLFPGAANWLALALVVVLTAAANALWRLHRGQMWGGGGAVDFASRQVLVDFALLIIAVHLTGGVGGPLAPLFALHGVLSAVLLPRRVAIRNLLVAVALLAASAAIDTIPAGRMPWRFADPDFAPAWVPLAVRMGFLAVTLAGATGLGLALAGQLRQRHARVSVLARELGERNRELEAVDEQRLSLLAVATHDLKSPLAAAESRLDLLFADQAGPLSTEQRYHLERIKTRLAGLRAFIADMLDLTALESQSSAEPIHAPVNVTDLLADALAEFTPTANQHGLDLDFARPPQPLWTMGDRNQLGRVWANLISNAVKYGVGGERIDIKVEAAGNVIRVAVTDYGIGISSADQERLFSDFFRARSARETGIPGTGLGLAISHRLIDRHGGTIAVTSVPGRGSTFTVTLPSCAAPNEPGPRSGAPPPAVVQGRA